MAGEKPDVLLIGNKKPVIVSGLEPKVTLHKLIDATDKDAFLKSIAGKVRALVVAYTNERISPEFMQRFPKLEQISSFGVGYDHIDAKWAGAHGIIVTNTPEVLNEEVADTALGLLLCTVREFAAIINPPHATILAVGAARRAAVETPDGGVKFVSQMSVTLSCDHRVVDGALGAELLAAFRQFVEMPVTALV